MSRSTSDPGEGGGADTRIDAALVEETALLLSQAHSALFVTGAGMSADSGLPTYRGIGGLYERALTPEGLPIEMVLSGAMLLRDPALTWRHIREIERACRGARHNAGHGALAELERRMDRTWVLTQNVDGLHVRAGSSNVIEIHGNIHRLRCVSCTYREEVEDYAALEVPPACPRCGALVRPDVVLFGEMLPEDATRALRRELDRGFDLVFSVGTTAVFPYIAGPILEAALHGTPTVEINPGESEVSQAVRLHLRSRAAPTLEAIVAAFVDRTGR